MSAQIIFLTGAPESSSLDWDAAGLLDDFTEPVARFAGIQASKLAKTPPYSNSSEPAHALWRALDIDRRHLPTGHSQMRGWQDEYEGNAAFFTASDLSFASSNPNRDTSLPLDLGQETVEEVLSQFYEHSFNLHANAASSQKVMSVSAQPGPQPILEEPSAIISNVSSSDSTTCSLLSRSVLETALPPSPIAGGGYVTDLQAIPDSRFVESIQPQTMTINLIVGIISAPPPRAVKTRRGSNLQIVELLVGDETKAGFGVNFWLSSGGNNLHDSNDMSSILASLRPQDVVLLRNIAVSSFCGRIYGQSLRKEMTKIHLLYRNRLDRTDVGGYYSIANLETGHDVHSQLTKTKRVKDWVQHFVAPGTFHRAKKGRVETVQEVLPLDTQ